MSQRCRLDSFDRRLLEILAVDARLSNTAIARTMDVSEGTVRSRLKRLREDGRVHFAVAGPTAVATGYSVFFGVTAEQEQVKEVAQAIAKMEEIRSVIVTLGRFDVYAVGVFAALEDMFADAKAAMQAIPGVRHVVTSITVKRLKSASHLTKAGTRAETAGEAA